MQAPPFPGQEADDDPQRMSDEVHRVLVEATSPAAGGCEFEVEDERQVEARCSGLLDGGVEMVVDTAGIRRPLTAGETEHEPRAITGPCGFSPFAVHISP